MCIESGKILFCQSAANYRLSSIIQSKLKQYFFFTYHLREKLEQLVHPFYVFFLYLEAAC